MSVCMKAITHLLPIILLIIFVLGSIYTGWSTPSEAAAVGVLGSFIIAIFSRTLNKKVFMEIILGSVKTSTMIMLIVCGASYLSVTIGYVKIPAQLTQFISEDRKSVV